MNEPVFTADGQPSEESIIRLADAYVAVLGEIRCDPFYWCGTPVIQDKLDAMVEAGRRSFGIDFESITDDRLRLLRQAATERGWSNYVEQLTPKISDELVADIFDDKGNVKPEAVNKLAKKFKECMGSLPPILTRSLSMMNLREEAMAEALEQAFGIETPGGPPRHIRDERVRRLAAAVFDKEGI